MSEMQSTIGAQSAELNRSRAVLGELLARSETIEADSAAAKAR